MARDGRAFETDVARVLVSGLRSADIVIMANLPAHRGSRVTALIEAAGARLVQLLPHETCARVFRFHASGASLALSAG